MIKFNLLCDKDHEFEIWFGSSEDFDKQKKRSQRACQSKTDCQRRSDDAHEFVDQQFSSRERRREQVVDFCWLKLEALPAVGFRECHEKHESQHQR